MRTRTQVILISILLCLLQASAFGNTLLTVSTSGVFSNVVPNDSPWLAPNVSWSLSFDISDQPVAENVDSLGFDAPFTNFEYVLNGVLLPDTAARVRFFYGAAGGMMTVFLVDDSTDPLFPDNDPITGLVFGNSAAQMFAGDPYNSVPPTMLTGSYLTQNQGVFSGGSQVQSLTGVWVDIQDSPEPATAATVAFLGLVGIAFLPRKKRN